MFFSKITEPLKNMPWKQYVSDNSYAAQINKVTCRQNIGLN